MNKRANYQDLLKLIAIIAMTIDHLGLYVYQDLYILRMIGRIVMPIFCFFVGYNFKSNPNSKILAFGLLLYASQLLTFLQFQQANMLITIYLGQCYLYIFHNALKKFATGYYHVIILGALLPLTASLSEYGSIAIAIIILGYITKHEKKKRQSSIVITSALSLLFTIANFEPVGIYLGITLLLTLTQYIIMSCCDFDKAIRLDLRMLTRNSLFFYFTQIMMFQYFLQLGFR